MVIGNELNFDNIMYTFHKYMEGINDYIISDNALTEINLSSFDMTNVTNSTNMFAGITPHIIVKDTQTRDIILSIKDTLEVTIIN